MHKNLITLLEYWQSICPADGVPHRDDLSPADIIKSLPNVFLLERMPDGDVVFRLMGTKVADRMGGDMTGRSVLDMMTEDVASYYRKLYDRVLGNPAGACVIAETEVEGCDPARFEFLHLPMWVGDEGSPQLIFGGSSTSHSRIWQVDLGGTFKETRQVGIDWIDLGFGFPNNEAGPAISHLTMNEALADA